MPSILANTSAKRCVDCEAVQTVASLSRTSATAQDGPSEAWLCIGQKYVAFSDFAFAATVTDDVFGGNVSTCKTSASRTTSASFACSGNPLHGLHSTFSARCARMQVHSSS